METDFDTNRMFKDLPGKPVLVLSKYITVIFLHGCSWHVHQNCEYFKMLKSRIDYWKPKILGNRKRDKKTLTVID